MNLHNLKVYYAQYHDYVSESKIISIYLIYFNKEIIKVVLYT